jgi:bifunctional DNA-binding transcriptional regulator/antitoxin component of YhaV-PrlF toxin-antitoxin module
MNVALKNKPPLVVPAAALRRAGFRRGQELEVKSELGVIMIVPRDFDEYSATERRALNRGIAQSLKEYSTEKGAGPFDTADAFLTDLHQGAANLDVKRRKRSRK